MEIYVDGILDNFKAFSGSLLTSTKPFTIGRMDNVETLYALLGSIDEVKLWNKEIPVSQIEQLKDQWATQTKVSDIKPITEIYPNPATHVIIIEFPKGIDVQQIYLFDMQGKKVLISYGKMQNSRITIDITQTSKGLYLLRMILKDGGVINRKIIIN
jgi:tricorn protease-like protein